MTGLRVHEVAKQLDTTTQELLTASIGSGLFLKSGSTKLADSEVEILTSAFLPYRRNRPTASAAKAKAVSVSVGLAPPGPILAPGIASAAYRSGTRQRPVPVDQLSPMELALMPKWLRGRRAVSWTDAALLRNESRRWAEAGFHHKNVRNWCRSGIAAQDAGFLYQRGVPASVLDLTLPIGLRSEGEMTIAEALTTREWQVERIYALLLETGLHTPPEEPEDLALPKAAATPAPARHVPPVVFSSPGSDGPAPTTPSPSRRPKNNRGQRRGPRRV